MSRRTLRALSSRSARLDVVVRFSCPISTPRPLVETAYATVPTLASSPTTSTRRSSAAVVVRPTVFLVVLPAQRPLIDVVRRTALLLVVNRRVVLFLMFLAMRLFACPVVFVTVPPSGTTRTPVEVSLLESCFRCLRVLDAEPSLILIVSP